MSKKNSTFVPNKYKYLQEQMSQDSNSRLAKNTIVLYFRMAFQMVDDALDCAPEEATGKPTGGDLREGKLTPPLQMYRDALDDAARAAFDKAFEEGSFTQAEVDAICLAVRERGYDARTREAAEGYLALARTALDAVPGVKERGILLQMADYVRDRKK